MKNKVSRLSIIKEVLESELISSQEELLKIMKTKGFSLTQATLSRDLKQLKVSKVPHNERGYIYKPLDYTETNKNTIPKGNMFAEYFKGIEFSHNIAVIRTYSGYANSTAIAIDGRNMYEILGTIAGDDTIILIMREGITPRQLKMALKTYFPELINKF